MSPAFTLVLVFMSSLLSHPCGRDRREKSISHMADRSRSAAAPLQMTANESPHKKTRRKTTMKNKTVKYESNVNQQTVLRDTPNGMPVKTRLKAGLKIKL
jgi:hypothetical protein